MNGRKDSDILIQWEILTVYYGSRPRFGDGSSITSPVGSAGYGLGEQFKNLQPCFVKLF